MPRTSAEIFLKPAACQQPGYLYIPRGQCSFQQDVCCTRPHWHRHGHLLPKEGSCNKAGQAEHKQLLHKINSSLFLRLLFIPSIPTW